MANSEQLKELLDAIRQLEKTTSVEFTNINNKLEYLKKAQEELKEDMEKFKEILNDPDDGLYKRLNDVVHDIKILSEEQNKCTDTLQEVEEEVNENTIIKQNLIKIAGERLEILDSTIKSSQNSKKILWTFILAGVAIAGEKLVEVLKLVF